MNRALTTTLPVSIVVVSRGRAAALRRCLLGLSQLQYAPFEIVVVADPDGIQTARAMPFSSDLKLIPFDDANISAARNIGVTHAAGEVIAFIDDDAVPEPTWLRFLSAPVVDRDVAALTGFVRGRNGISFQNKARGLDHQGFAHPLDVDPQETTILTPPKGRAVKTEGTNMAFRRSVLVELGGFDTAFHYFLDETDLNMRLARAGYATAIVPSAEVHHGFEANGMRRSDRVPTDLYDIGASWAVFQRKHVPRADRATQYSVIREDERKRALRLMVTGHLEPRDVRRLLSRLARGYADGQSRPLGTARLPRHAALPFLPFPARPRESVFQAARMFRRKEALALAEKRAEDSISSLLLLSPTALYHRQQFTESGVWLQRGGLFGRAERSESLFRGTTFSRRAARERRRVAKQRGVIA